MSKIGINQAKASKSCIASVWWSTFEDDPNHNDLTNINNCQIHPSKN
jgi:hypothetical protein